MRLPLLLFLILLLLGGCAASRQGFDRDAMRAVIQSPTEPARTEVTGSALAAAQPPAVPLRLALYFVPQAFPARGSLRPPEWVSSDKERLTGWLAPLRQEGILGGIFLLVDPIIRNADVGALRQAASRYGADALLIVQGVGGVDRYANGYAALYPTLIGAYFAPGTHSDALFLITGALQDVRSDWREGTQTVEGHVEVVGPAMMVEDRQALADAKKAALDELGQRIAALLRRLKP
jgi:hypothetical protein